MNMKTEIQGWKFYGESTQSALVSGVLPQRGVHFIVADDKETARAIVADLCVAVAAGSMGGGLSEPGQDRKRRSLASFFGLGLGEGRGVAIIGATDLRSVTAAALGRGVQAKLPIAVSTAQQSDVISTSLHYMRREVASGVALVILAADFDSAGAIQRVAAYRSDDYALLVVAPQEPPAALVQPDTHVMRVADGALSLMRPATINNWSRSFTVETIRLPSGEAQIVRPDLADAEPPIVVERAVAKMSDAEQAEYLRSA